MYLWARHWGIQPSEFWEMTISEWWCEYEAKAADQSGRFAGNLTQNDVDELNDWLAEKAAEDGRKTGNRS